MKRPILLKKLKKTNVLNGLVLLFLTACQMQNSGDIIDHVTDPQGNGITSFEEVYRNQEEDFRVRDAEGVETFERQIMAPGDREHRRAVVVSDEPLSLKQGHRDSSAVTGYNLSPLTEVDVFWPLNVANDHVEVEWVNPQNQKITGWLQYIDANGTQLVRVIEDFVIETVTLEGARIVLTHVDEPTPITNIEIEASSEVIELEPAQEPEEEPLEIEEEPLVQPPLQPVEEETPHLTEPDPEPEPEPVDEAEPVEQTAIAPPITDDEDETEEPLSHLEPHDHDHDHAEPEEEPSEVSDLAVTRSIRPQPRPDNLVTTPPERPAADIIETLGLTPINIPFSIDTARSRITAIGPAQRFSGCSFSPALGNRAGRDCYRDLILADDFVEFLEEHAHQCSIQAARETFNRTPTLIQFTSNGGALGRANRSSLHHRGRAIDLFYATLFWSEDRTDKRQVRFHVNSTDGSSQEERENHDYYWAFVDCWRDKIRTHAPNSCGAARRGGALTYRYNNAHRDHIHLALPLTNAERRRHSINCI